MSLCTCIPAAIMSAYAVECLERNHRSCVGELANTKEDKGAAVFLSITHVGWSHRFLILQCHRTGDRVVECRGPETLT
ncbi:hypothetical protein BD309DRAFT_953517 [Dichomitus squalens]|nr:hypothetical protein BD309DRAFT_953517 [Dichomitus squalens]